MTAHSPDIAKKAQLPHGPDVGLRLQERYGPYRAGLARRSGISCIWQALAGNTPVFTTQTRFDIDYGRQILVASESAMLPTTVRAVLRGTGP